MFDFSVFKQLSLFQKSTHPALFSVCLKLIFSFYNLILNCKKVFFFFSKKCFLHIFHMILLCVKKISEKRTMFLKI